MERPARIIGPRREIGVGLAQINAQGIGVGLAQISWLPHEQRAALEESRLRQLDRRAMVRSEGEIAEQHIKDESHSRRQATSA